MKPTDLIDWLLPPDDADAAGIRRHRQRLTLVACTAWMAVFLFVLPALVPGVPYPIKVAWGSDIDKKIAAAVQPIQQAVADSAKASQDQAQATRALKLQLLERDIFSAIIEKCAAKSRGTGARLWTERLQQLKSDYQVLTGRVYDEPDCSDL